MINPGTPEGIPSSFDCKARRAAWEYGKSLLPARGSFKSLYDALQVGACTSKLRGVVEPKEMDEWAVPTFAVPLQSTGEVFVDASIGDDKTRKNNEKGKENKSQTERVSIHMASL